MYEDVIKILLSSNIGSYIKEDIINNDLINKCGSNEYYGRLKEILSSNNSTFAKEKELVAYLKSN